ncbi:hypothetical protein A3A63_03130 [Candidatus Gottesmanbacteria bacterium RIFCSPLOWO2_01_FULL_46_9]|uniref:Phosphodiester glycosidase domain-containing protein n=1 Tax=Candidatus Gottesmanbacteria bacterium RIFCSPLOWO2_01_FULL_46_9 TaxID=1798394 RepID=A0A1F6AY00_9BACT|nr:MAG: hypothetical protein A3A63_03130 [Candidatus Gottesmanbacteria bacterium RIFCSPLOWO2_01_FULL_46_9]
MKPVLFITAFCIALIVIVVTAAQLDRPQQPHAAALVSTPTPTARPSLTHKTVEWEGETYAYAFTQATPSRISLIANFSPRLDAATIMRSHDCQSAINGGFYDTNNKPLGYFKTQGKTMGTPTVSALFNGFFSIDQLGVVSVAHEIPQNPLLAVQTGPLLIESGETIPLRIKNDERARRMIGAVSTSQAVLFLTVYNPEAVFEGPRLGDLPEIVKKIGYLESLAITSAINFDGGSASAFYSDTTKLSELTPIGSLFCVKSQVQ